MKNNLGRSSGISSSTPDLETDSLDEQKGDVSELVRRLRTSRSLGGDAWGGGIVLIGAGCSVSAGIPDSLGVVDIALQHIAIRAELKEKSEVQSMKGQDLYNLLKEENLLSDIQSRYSSDLYPEIFEKIFSEATQEREVIREAIERAAHNINWAHLRLGQLVKAKCIHTILTTNFDLLALKGLVRNGIWPVVADGLEALTRVDPRPVLPQLVHIHGSLHNYRRINSIRQLKQVGSDSEVYRSISSLLRDAPFLLIVGYRGEEAGLMAPLKSALNSFEGKPVYWTFYGQEASPAALELQRHGKAKILFGQDADRLFDSLANGLNLGLPEWMERPIDVLKNDFDNIVRNPSIGGLVTVFDKHRGKISQLQTCWDHNASQTSDSSSEVRFAAAILAGDLKTAENQITDGPNAFQQRAILLQAAANAVIDQKQKSAAQILLDCWEKLDDDQAKFFSPEGRLRIAEAFLEIEAVDIATTMLQTVYPVLTDEKLKSYWAHLQHRLGFKLTRTIAPTSGQPRLLDAIIAYRAALRERSLERSPRLWANTHNNLGTALYKLADLKDSPDLLREAITAYREALQVRTQARAPSYWAATSSNLAAALTALGSRVEDASKIKEAVELLHQIISTQSRDQAPEKWADRQDSLGSALWSLGILEHDSARFEEAITAHRRSLEIKNRETAPLKWARTTEKLAWVENSLGDMTNDPSHWRAALSHVEECLEEYRAAEADLYIKEATELRDDLMAKLSL